MEEIDHFLTYSKQIISRKIVQISFSTDDLETDAFAFRNLTSFLYDPDLNVSEEITNFNDQKMALKKNYYDHYVFSDLIYEERYKLNGLFMNFIKENVFKEKKQKQKNRLRSYSFQDFCPEKLLNLYSFSYLLKRALKKVFLTYLQKF